MPITKIGRLQIEADAASQSTLFWRVQKIVVIILGLFLLGVIFGLTGDGILGNRVAASKDGNLTIRYDIFTRKNASATLSAHMAQASSDISLYLPKSFVDGIYIKQITPTPVKVEVQKDQVVYTFAGSNSAVTFFFEPLSSGFNKLEIGLLQGSSVIISQLVYP